MNSDTQLSQLGSILVDSMHKIDKYEAAILARREKNTIHVPTVGSKLSSAYEQLRNASEYAEDNLLRQRAIRRYYKRVLSFHEKVSTRQVAEELITELTQSGYLPNDHTTDTEVKHLSAYIKQYYNAYWQYKKIETSQNARNNFEGWVLDVLSVRSEQTLHSNIRQLYFTQLAFTYFYEKLDLTSLTRTNEQINPGDLPIILYIAVQKSILKLDEPTIRTALIDSYRQNINRIHNFETFNTKLDRLFEAKTTQYTTRIVSRNSAALRMIYSGFYAESGTLTTSNLQTEDSLDYHLRQHIEKEYDTLNKKLDSGIVKSIVFLLITKSIIGLAIEIPYDLAVFNHIALLPLVLNLFFPSVFIAMSRLTLNTPGIRNTNSIVDQIKEIVYATNTKTFTIRTPKQSHSTGFNLVYSAMFLASFTGLTYILYLLQFNIVQGVIFFVFLSTASFLAFRLASQIRELETTHTIQGGVALIRDIIYLPFIYVGQYISDRYAKINVIATVLDLMIELPLKTVLRLIRQWTLFLNNKKDEIV